MTLCDGGVVVVGAVVDGVQAEVVKLSGPEIAPGLVELALSLARAIDDTDGPAARAAAARELRAVMADLRRLAPVAQEGDQLDELTKKREARRARPA
ncbi:hypothetical protein [Streptomyces uncialis]|uniref:hypothetical protein n=1 Tax=Streptomyces uncialis TaxID=1048205 RepID=UPI00340D39E4